MTLRLLERGMGEKLPDTCFFSVWKKRPQRSFLVKGVYPQNSLTYPLVGEYLKSEEMKNKHSIYTPASNLDFFKGNSQLCLKLLGRAEKDIYITVVLNLHILLKLYWLL